MDYFNQLSKAEKLNLYSIMKKIRFFEQAVFQLTGQGLVHGSVHFYIGQEAIAAGIISCLNKEDYIISTHRCHGHMIAKGADMKKMLAEIMGRIDGYCKGKGGTMHLMAPEVGVMGANGIVGAGIPIASGIAYACSMFKKDRLVVCFFGDGAINTGAFHEALNLSALWKLPILFVCENNKYAISMDINKSASIADISLRAASYGIKGYNINGNNVAAVRNTAKKCIKDALSKRGPSLIICNTYRQMGHSIHDTRKYRSKEEENKWLKKDPILKYEKFLKKEGIINQSDIESIEAEIKNEIDSAVQFAIESKKPDKSELYKYVYKLC